MGMGKDEHVVRWRERKEYESGVDTTATVKERSACRNLKRAETKVTGTKTGLKGCEGMTNTAHAP